MSAMIRLFALLALLVPGVAWGQPIPGAGCPKNASPCTVTATGGTTATLANWMAALAAQFPVTGNGVKADEITVTDGTIAASSSTLTSAASTFTAADVGKSIVLVGSGSAGADQSGTITGFTSAHTVTVSFTSVLATPWVGLRSAVVATAQSGAGSYAPGDTLTVSGGTTVTTAAIATIKTTQLVSATVNAAGSGGTTGACTLTGTTGTTVSGTRFSIAATISGGSISALGSITVAGVYTTNPTSLSAEPVTSNCNLAGSPTLTLKMGALNILTTTVGHYAALPANPAATTTSGSGTGATLTLTQSSIGGRMSYGTDNTTAINNAFTAANTNGGALVFPCGNLLVMGALQPPYTGSNNPVQNPFRLTGCGATVDSYLSTNPTSGGLGGVPVPAIGGTALDLRYTGGDGLHPAKIDTRGSGLLEIDHIAMVDGGTDNFLLLQTTNTTLNVHDARFVGNPSCWQVTCQQNAIRLGGITSAASVLGTDVATDGYQGYDTRIESSAFDFMQEVVQFGGSANGVYVANNAVSFSSGSSATQGAPYHFYGAGLGASGNLLYGGIVEMAGYVYAVAMTSVSAGTNIFNKIDGLGLYDEVLASPTLGAIYQDANSTFNSFVAGFLDSPLARSQIANPGSGASNTFINAVGTGASLLRSAIQNTSTDSNYFTNTLGVGNSSPAQRLDVGDGTSATQFARINSGASGTAGGPGLRLEWGGSFRGGLLGYSALFGGTIDKRTVVYGFDGIVFDTNNVVVGTVDTTGHWRIGAVGVTTITSGACGTGANGTIVAGSNDHDGQINIGAAATTACAVSYASTWGTAPRACTFSPNNATAAGATILPWMSAPTTTGFTLNGSVLASTNWQYHCE